MESKNTPEQSEFKFRPASAEADFHEPEDAYEDLGFNRKSMNPTKEEIEKMRKALNRPNKKRNKN